MKRALLIGCLSLAAAASQATVWGFSAPLLNGAQEVPPTGSDAYGTSSYTIDDLSWIISGSVTITGLNIGEVVAMHIHHAPPGVNGPVIFDILATTVSTHQQGNVSNWFFTGTLEDGQGLTRLQKLAIMVQGNAYINAHTAAFPGGEIRGQIECVVPEPATFAGIGVGMAGMLFLKRRRQ